jgi:predicted PurR-regulated permease PerM
MLGIDRNAARFTWTVVAVLLLVGLVYRVRTTLFVFILALLFAYLLYPLVNFLDRAIPFRGTRGLALTLSYMIFLGVVIVIFMQVGTRVAAQAETLSKKFPEMAANWEARANRPGDSPLKQEIIDNVRDEIARRASDVLHMLPAAGVKLMSVASDLIFVVIIPILAFFFLKDGEEIRAHILGLVDSGPWRRRVDGLLEDVHLLLAHYMRALVLLSLATFVAYSIAFSLMGLPFGILLAVIAMCLEIIPALGPLVAVVLIVLVTAVSGASLPMVIGFLALYRLFQDYVLSPFLMGQGVELHPLVVLFGVFAGAEVAGVAGSFLSVPILALVRILYLHMRRSRLSSAADGPATVLTTVSDRSPG